MIINNNQTILVINDVEATRESIKDLLARDGYNVGAARDERDAAVTACIKLPDLVLISLDGETAEVIESVQRIRKSAPIVENVPVIIFCADGSEENEAAVGGNIYLACPENFNQLRKFISRLLRQFQKAAQI